MGMGGWISVLPGNCMSSKSDYAESSLAMGCKHGEQLARKHFNAQTHGRAVDVDLHW